MLLTLGLNYKLLKLVVKVPTYILSWHKLILTSWEIIDNADLVKIVSVIKNSVLYMSLFVRNYIIIIFLWYMVHMLTSKYYIY